MSDKLTVVHADNCEDRRDVAVIEGTREKPVRVRWDGGGVYTVRDGWLYAGTRRLQWRVA